MHQPHNSPAEPPPLEFSEETLDMMKSLIAKIEAHLKQEADIRKEEEEAYQKVQSSTYWAPQCREEEPSPQLYG